MEDLTSRVVNAIEKHQLAKEPATYEVLESDTGASHEEVVAVVTKLEQEGKVVGVNLFQQL